MTVKGLRFGQIDIPVGGILPPAPTYKTIDGEERKACLLDITPCNYPSGRRLLTFGVIDLHNSVLAFMPGMPKATAKTRSPWNHD